MSSTYAQLEYQRVQLIHQLNQVAVSMRNCATMAEQFAHAISGIPLTSANGDKAQLAIAPVSLQAAKHKGQNIEDGESEVLGSKRKKTVRKPRDPNAPKRPPSTYLIFQNEVRSELKAKFPQLPNSELLQMISKRWAAMSDVDKEVYSKMNATAKEVYAAQKATYDATTAAPATTPVTPSVSNKKAKSPPKAVAPAPTTETSSSSDESEESGSDESSEEASASEEEDDEERPPPPKKVKKTAPAAPPPKEKKEKKQKA